MGSDSLTFAFLTADPFATTDMWTQGDSGRWTAFEDAGWIETGSGLDYSIAKYSNLNTKQFKNGNVFDEFMMNLGQRERHLVALCVKIHTFLCHEVGESKE